MKKQAYWTEQICKITKKHSERSFTLDVFHRRDGSVLGAGIKLQISFRSRSCSEVWAFRGTFRWWLTMEFSDHSIETLLKTLTGCTTIPCWKSGFVFISIYQVCTATTAKSGFSKGDWKISKVYFLSMFFYNTAIQEPYKCSDRLLIHNTFVKPIFQFPARLFYGTASFCFS